MFRGSAGSILLPMGHRVASLRRFRCSAEPAAGIAKSRGVVSWDLMAVASTYTFAADIRENAMIICSACNNLRSRDMEAVIVYLLNKFIRVVASMESILPSQDRRQAYMPGCNAHITQAPEGDVIA